MCLKCVVHSPFRCNYDPVSWTEMQCPLTGQIEQRKVAKAASWLECFIKLESVLFCRNILTCIVVRVRNYSKSVFYIASWPTFKVAQMRDFNSLVLWAGFYLFFIVFFQFKAIDYCHFKTWFNFQLWMELVSY